MSAHFLSPSIVLLSHSFLVIVLSRYTAAVEKVVERNPIQWASKKRNYWPGRLDAVYLSAIIERSLTLSKSVWANRLRSYDDTHPETPRGFKYISRASKDSPSSPSRQIKLDTYEVRYAVGRSSAGGQLACRLEKISGLSAGCVGHPRFFSVDSVGEADRHLSVKISTAWSLCVDASYAIVDCHAGSQFEEGTMRLMNNVGMDDVKTSTFDLPKFIPSPTHPDAYSGAP